MATGVTQAPRALVLSLEDRNVVIKRLARAVLRFQDAFLEQPGSPAGLLCQVWLPEVTGENEVVLKTKGMPFCVAGLGDLLALFRCISCRFAFGTDVKKVAQLGAPGRVFTSSEPELTCNVQKYSKTAYLRKAEAEQCQVQSTLLLPVFLSAARHGCVGVLEVVQTSEDMHFTQMAELIASMLEKCQLYTCTRVSIERQLPRATTTATLLLPPTVDILKPQQATSDDSAERANSTDGVPMAAVDVLEQATFGSAGNGAASGSAQAAAGRPAGEGGGAAPAAGQAAGAGAAGQQQQHWQQQQQQQRRRASPAESQSGEEDDDEDMDDGGESGDEGEEEQGRVGRGGRGDGKSMGTAGTGRRRGKGTGNPGKPGVRLSLEDLQSQFGVGLKEAAARLGICPTTLKRACRRHGIQRWPRRQLMKVNQALDQMEAGLDGGPMALLQHQQAQQAAAAAAALSQQHSALQQHPQLGGLGGLPGPDTRWTTLAQFIPAFQQTMQYNELAMLGGGQGPLGLPGLAQQGNPLGLGGMGGPGWGGPNGLAPGMNGAGARFSNNGLLPQTFAELDTRGGFQHGKNGGGGGAASEQGRASSSLPGGVLQMPQPGGGGGGANGIFSLPTTSVDGPALSGISSFGQPPPPAGNAAAAQQQQQQRVSAFRPAPVRASANGATSHGAGAAPVGLAGIAKGSWQLPSLPITPLGASIDFDLNKAGQLAEEQMRDDDVGFLDSTVLEMLLQEDAGRAAAVGALAPGIAASQEEMARGLAMSGALGSLKFK